jgi:2-polyprenyl-3-methyl-5-hydroxy-6-metoxy-1,4-benzoquinol methylase
MTTLLRTRAAHLSELMDAPDCDPKALEKTYAQFDQINRLLSGWRNLYIQYLRPALAKEPDTASVLDIGCGGGDVLRRLARWAKRDGLSVRLTGIDPDERAIRFACDQTNPPNVRFAQNDSRTLAQGGQRFTVVLSNHVLHHLGSAEVTALCTDSEALASRLVLHNDIARSMLAFRLFPFARLLFRHSFIVEDGLRSIRRSFTAEEIRSLAPSGWDVQTAVPFHWQLMREVRS